jgi:bifunctional ADP-heptose synthase (sugar kinase/adenylyltransferase)
LGCRAIILTRSERGITVFEQNSMTTIPPIVSPNQFARPVGVRDAMTSVLSLAIAAGANSFEGAALSNLAASLRGDRSGTIVLSADEIVQNISSVEKALSNVVSVPVRR